MNRVLALTVADQNLLFNGFMRHYESIIEGAKQRGELDKGTEVIRHEGARILEEKTVLVDEVTGEETKYFKIETKQRNKKTPFSKLEQNAKDRGLDEIIVYRNKKSGKLWGWLGDATVTKLDGGVRTESVLISPNSSYQYIQPYNLRQDNKWEKLENKAAVHAWHNGLEAVPDLRDEVVHLISAICSPSGIELRVNLQFEDSPLMMAPPSLDEP